MGLLPVAWPVYLLTRSKSVQAEEYAIAMVSGYGYVLVPPDVGIHLLQEGGAGSSAQEDTKLMETYVKATAAVVADEGVHM